MVEENISHSKWLAVASCYDVSPKRHHPPQRNLDALTVHLHALELPCQTFQTNTHYLQLPGLRYIGVSLAIMLSNENAKTAKMTLSLEEK
jgi:flagellar basal body-associated protein FliL